PEFYDPDLAFGYRWLERQTGFAPVFLSVGDKLEDVYMTGYQNNWRVCMGYDGRGIHNHRTRGEFPNDILFSFSSIAGVFMDYEQWHLVMATDEYLPKNYKNLLFKPSWSRSKWERHAQKHPGCVQLVAPSLDLRLSERIWVRNKETKQILLNMGFENVEVRRIPVS
ncbi:MAG TPA: hypothetical protein VJJ75_01920, partial [Candidatus Nanoarchaeia archaeon]|nr:hypothetical protein [Candidatus Nanoarchaeia archaeon]